MHDIEIKVCGDAGSYSSTLAWRICQLLEKEGFNVKCLDEEMDRQWSDNRESKVDAAKAKTAITINRYQISRDGKNIFGPMGISR